MRVLVILAVLVGVLCLVDAYNARCGYSCSSRYKCGFLWQKRCTRRKTCYKACDNGGWSSWRTSYSTCSKTCGSGTQTVTKVRQCNNPTPKNGGKPCSGSSRGSYVQRCNTHRCPIHGDWSSWITYDCWSSCSRSCGGGVQSRPQKRDCNHPPPRYGGGYCRGASRKRVSRSCNTHACPIHGGWSSWGTIFMSTCSKECGGGVRTIIKTRSCSSPTPRYGGLHCSGSNFHVQKTSCNTHKCPRKDGGWTTWTDVVKTPCSKSCGGGSYTVFKSRSCTNPTPLHGGLTCSGKKTRTVTRTCNTKPCPLDGGWSNYTETSRSECSVTCGHGTLTLTLTRSCSDPAPQHGGQDCTGNTSLTDTHTCNLGPCPVDGGWTGFVEASRTSCSVTCGTGTLSVTKTRSCTDPSPLHGGQGCTGNTTTTDTTACHLPPCPVDGGWSDYVETSRSLCSSTCDNGTMTVTMTRSCSNPGPQHGGQNCTGHATKTATQSCFLEACPPDDEWSKWSEWRSSAPCPVACGGGEREETRTRTCVSLVDDVNVCNGTSVDRRTVICNVQDCNSLCAPNSNKLLPAEDEEFYYQCVPGDGRTVNTTTVLKKCPGGTKWNQNDGACTHNVPAINVEDTSNTTTSNSDNSNTTPTTTTSNSNNNSTPIPNIPAAKCTEGTTRADPEDCRFFMVCAQGQEIKRQCSGDLKFDQSLQSCTWADKVKC